MSNTVDLVPYLPILDSMPLEKLDQISQGCQQSILFNILDKAANAKLNDEYFTQCQSVL